MLKHYKFLIIDVNMFVEIGSQADIFVDCPTLIVELFLFWVKDFFEWKRQFYVAKSLNQTHKSVHLESWKFYIIIC